MTGSQRTWANLDKDYRTLKARISRGHCQYQFVLTSWDPAAAWHTRKLFDLETKTLNSDCTALSRQNSVSNTAIATTPEMVHRPLGFDATHAKDTTNLCANKKCCEIKTMYTKIWRDHVLHQESLVLFTLNSISWLGPKRTCHTDTMITWVFPGPFWTKKTRDSREVGEAKTERKASNVTSSKVVSSSWHLVLNCLAFVLSKHGTLRSDLRIQNLSATVSLQIEKEKMRNGEKENNKNTLHFTTSSEPTTLPSFRLPSNGAAEKQVLKKEKVLVNESSKASFSGQQNFLHISNISSFSLLFVFFLFCLFILFSDLNTPHLQAKGTEQRCQRESQVHLVHFPW